MSGPESTISLPTRLLAEVVPTLDQAELRVLLALYVRGVGAPGGQSAVDDLQGDTSLLQSLARDSPVAAREAVHRAIDRLLARGILAYADETRHHLRLRATASVVPGAILATGDEQAKRALVARLYEENIGLLQPIIVEELHAAARLYPEPWIVEAFAEAARYNRRNWRYVRRILERWATQGRGPAATGAGTSATATARPAGWVQTYRRGEHLPDL